MLRFVLLELSEPENLNTLKLWTEELLSAVIVAGADWRWCAELVGSCIYKPEMIELARRVLMKVRTKGRDEWIVSSGLAVASLNQLIQYAQPKYLNVDILRTEPISTHIQQMVELLSDHFSGSLTLYLRHSYHCYKPCDIVVMKLVKTR